MKTNLFRNLWRMVTWASETPTQKRIKPLFCVAPLSAYKKPLAHAPVLPFSIDWEDWFQLCCPPYDLPDAYSCYEDRLEFSTERTLSLCQDLGARATWFCLADQAQRHPGLINQILLAGHEIALHGLDHRRAFSFSKEGFTTWVREGKARLEQLTGRPVVGFRAPEWSLRGKAVDYWRVLPNLGFHYDASRASLAILGNTVWPKQAHCLENDLWELPPPVASIGIYRVPLWGWGMRLLPAFWLKSQLRQLAQADAGTPLVLHPWELDEGQPRLTQASLGHRFTHSAGMKGFDRKLQRLLQDFQLFPIEDWLDQTDRVKKPGGPCPN